MKSPRSFSTPDARRRSTRRGFTTPAVAIALLVVMAGLALILDRLWLDAADLELTTAAEIAALAAAGELASDDLLKSSPNPDHRLDMARNSASWIASQNYVAGDPVQLDSNPEGDIRLGKLVLDEFENKIRFEETTDNPMTAVVSSLRSRRSSNPVGLFTAGVTGQPFGDVATRVEASVDNRVVGLRPLKDAPIPALPIAIWLNDPTGRRNDTWRTQIEARKGKDEFGYDSLGHHVTEGADGIPEMTLRSQAPGGGINLNTVVVDVGAGLSDTVLAQQFARGFSTEDLVASGGELSIFDATPQTLRASGELRHGDREALESIIGEPRICLLYSTAVPAVSGDIIQATCVRMVAVRVLSVRDLTDGSCELVVQPCIVKTRTAILDAPQPYSTENVVPVSPYLTNPTHPATGATTTQMSGSTPVTTGSGHPFIYKLHLTH